MSPFVRIRERFGVNVSSLSVGGFRYEIDVVGRASLVQPVNRHSVRTPKVSHRGVATSLADPNHGLIVFVKRKNNFAHADHRPQVKGWQATRPEREMTSDNLSLWRGMRHATLAFADPIQWITGRRTTNAQVDA